MIKEEWNQESETLIVLTSSMQNTIIDGPAMVKSVVGLNFCNQTSSIQ